uniref:Uncharacterized protein n=1 Tax=viral metagenome TaxID=1070528 RepID=A0A6C0CZ68_9ZZZZ
MVDKSTTKSLCHQKEWIQTLCRMVGYLLAISFQRYPISFWLVISYYFHVLVSFTQENDEKGKKITSYKIFHLSNWFLSCERARQSTILWGICTRFLSVFHIFYPIHLSNITCYTLFYNVIIAWIHSIPLYLIGGYILSTFIGYIFNMLSDILFVFEVYDWCYYTTIAFHMWIGVGSFVETLVMTSKDRVTPFFIQKIEEFSPSLDNWTRYLSLSFGLFYVGYHLHYSKRFEEISETNSRKEGL